MTTEHGKAIKNVMLPFPGSGNVYVLVPVSALNLSHEDLQSLMSSMSNTGGVTVDWISDYIWLPVNIDYLKAVADNLVLFLRVRDSESNAQAKRSKRPRRARR